MSRTFRYKRAQFLLPDNEEMNELRLMEEGWYKQWRLSKLENGGGRDPLLDSFNGRPWSLSLKKETNKHVRSDNRRLIHKILTDPEMDHVATIGKKRITDWDFD